MIENIRGVVDELRQYQPTPEERAWGMLSSIKSEGAVGGINGTIARICHQEDADVIGFIKGFRETFTL